MKTHRIPAAIAAAIASMTIAACSGTSEAEREAPTVAQESAEITTSPPAPIDTGAAAETTERTASQTVGGDGSPIRLSPLGSADVEAADLAGELACSFASGEGETLLLATGDVASQEPAFGVVKVGDYVESVSTAGGFDAMIRGATFAGRGKTVEIERTASQPIGGGESPPFPARLTYQRADGASRSFDGLWTCGP